VAAELEPRGQQVGDGAQPPVAAPGPDEAVEAQVKLGVAVQVGGAHGMPLSFQQVTQVRQPALVAPAGHAARSS
jgi:hypothetical protein